MFFIRHHPYFSKRARLIHKKKKNNNNNNKARLKAQRFRKSMPPCNFDFPPVYDFGEKSVLHLLQCWQGCFQRCIISKVWLATPLSVMWILCYELNMRFFDGVEHPTFLIKEHILRSLYNQMQVQSCINSMSKLIAQFSSLCDLYCLICECSHPLCHSLSSF